MLSLQPEKCKKKHDKNFFITICYLYKLWTQTNEWALLFFILMIILVVTLERMLYTSGEVTLRGKTEISLLEAIEDGFDAQYKALGLYEATSKMEPNRSFEHCTVLSSKGKSVKDIVVEESKVVVTSDIDTRIHHTVLAKEGIDVDACLSLWSKKLFEANIVSCHALQIHIHADSAYVLACGDSTLFSPEYKKVSSIYAGLSRNRSGTFYSILLVYSS